MSNSIATYHRESRRQRRGISGFTLVEMLVSMAILGLIVLLMGRIFSESSDAVKQGLKSSDQNLNGRVILDYIARELRQAMVDDNLTITVEPSNKDPYDLGEGLNDEVTFATIGGTNREVEIIRYYISEKNRKIGGASVDSYRLSRVVEKDDEEINEAYDKGIDASGAWLSGGPAMVRNVTGFAIKLYQEDASGNMECVRNLGEKEQLTTLPNYADVYLGILGDSDLVEASITKDPEFIHSREMIFMKRVYFRNHRGYNTGYGRKYYEK